MSLKLRQKKISTGPVRFSWAVKKAMPHWPPCANASIFLVCIMQTFALEIYFFVAVSAKFKIANCNDSNTIGGGCTIDCTTEDRIVCITPRQYYACLSSKAFKAFKNNEGKLVTNVFSQNNIRRDFFRVLVQVIVTSGVNLWTDLIQCKIVFLIDFLNGCVATCDCAQQIVWLRTDSMIDRLI